MGNAMLPAPWPDLIHLPTRSARKVSSSLPDETLSSDYNGMNYKIFISQCKVSKPAAILQQPLPILAHLLNEIMTNLPHRHSDKQILTW